jgi:biotin carboxyl carrier protein
MRIDASTLLLAAQAQSQRAAAPKAPAEKTAFEPPDLTAPSAGEARKQTAQPGTIVRPGTQLDIKV